MRLFKIQQLCLERGQHVVFFPFSLPRVTLWCFQKGNPSPAPRFGSGFCPRDGIQVLHVNLCLLCKFQARVPVSKPSGN